MSKYEPLWNYIKENKKENYNLTYDEIKNILGNRPFFLNLLKRINQLWIWSK